MEVDPIWEALCHMGRNPEPFNNLGYIFVYHGLKGIYFPKKKESDIVRFVIPKLIGVDNRTSEEITRWVNMTNSMVSECKFIIMRNEVWLIHERFMSDFEDHKSIVVHILENLKQRADLFNKLS